MDKDYDRFLIEILKNGLPMLLYFVDFSTFCPLQIWCGYLKGVVGGIYAFIKIWQDAFKMRLHYCFI
jgi:hypothetical protein